MQWPLEMTSQQQSDSDTDRPFDNFYSPRNIAFYNSSPYTPLDPSQQEIRLLKLSAGAWDDPVACELLAPLPFEEAKSSYLAISYCAGDPEVTEPIIVNGLTFNAFANLEVALRRVRASAEEFQHPDHEPQMLWVDQICIDQSNPEERAHQVCFMRNIYEGAGQTVVWLGERRSEMSGIQFLESLYESSERILSLPIERNDDPDDEWSPRDYVVNIIGTRIGSSEVMDPSFVKNWMGLREVVSSPWWRRCWVAQELIVSQDPVIMLGSNFISWEGFEIAFDIVIVICRTIFSTTYGKLQSRNVDAFESQEFEHAKLLIGGIETEYVQFMIEHKKRWDEGMTIELRPLLEGSMRLQSSDPRDRIYAFLGLVDRAYNIIPNYQASNSINDTLCLTAKRIILHDARLEILPLAQEDGRSDLPSWVPNWCINSPELPLRNKRFQASENYPAITSFHSSLQGQKDRVLRTACLFIDQLATEVTLIEPVQAIDAVLEHSGSIPSVNDVYFTGETFKDAFLSTLYFGREEEFTEDTGDEMGDGNSPEFYHEWIKSRNHLRTTLHSHGISGRRFFYSPKGYIGLTDSRSRHTDLIVVLFGTSVPMILRKVGAHYKLIGEAYVHGFMDGEAIQLMKNGELEVHTIEII